MRLSDKNLVQAALKTYARHLRGFEHDNYIEDLKRVEELQKKEIIANRFGLTIKLDV